MRLMARKVFHFLKDRKHVVSHVAQESKKFFFGCDLVFPPIQSNYVYNYLRISVFYLSLFPNFLIILTNVISLVDELKKKNRALCNF